MRCDFWEVIIALDNTIWVDNTRGMWLDLSIIGYLLDISTSIIIADDKNNDVWWLAIEMATANIDGYWIVQMALGPLWKQGPDPNVVSLHLDVVYLRHWTTFSLVSMSSGIL